MRTNVAENRIIFNFGPKAVGSTDSLRNVRRAGTLKSRKVHRGTPPAKRLPSFRNVRNRLISELSRNTTGRRSWLIVDPARLLAGHTHRLVCARVSARYFYVVSRTPATYCRTNYRLRWSSRSR